MTPFLTLASARAPDGAELTLHSRGRHFYLHVNRQPLMGTNAFDSESALADATCRGLLPHPPPRVLIGGLGFGFTLKRVLELVGRDASVHVAELVPEIVEWNRRFLANINGRLLDDPRVKIFIGDVFQSICQSPPAHFQSILLDVDNGPTAMVQDGNDRLYQDQGFAAIHRALKPGGRAAFWSASPDKSFAKRLAQAGFLVQVHSTKPHPQARRASHTIFLAERNI